jgi:hypothetical protein
MLLVLRLALVRRSEHAATTRVVAMHRAIHRGTMKMACFFENSRWRNLDLQSFFEVAQHHQYSSHTLSHQRKLIRML